MTIIRVLYRSLGLILITGASVAIPLLARILTLNSTSLSARVGSRALSFWSRSLCTILGVRIRATGRPSGEIYLVASNHVSYLDIWVLGSLYPSLFVAKREIRSWPVLGWVSRAAGTLFVDRDSPRDAVRVIRSMKKYLAAGISITLFPEGSISKGKSVQPFLPTLLEPAATIGVPCYAVSLSYETPGTPEPPSRTICWDGGRNFVKHIVGIMQMPSVVATVSFSPTPVSSSSRKELAERLWEEVSGSFIPLRQEADRP